MIQVIANGIEIHGYITDYKINVTPIEPGNSFTAYDGTPVVAISGYKTVIDCALTKVPQAYAEKIAEIVTAGSFDVTYTTPVEITGKFRCKKYNAVPKSSDPRQKNPLITENVTWNISMTLECVAADPDGSRL